MPVSKFLLSFDETNKLSL
jgi:hypothetical protein